MSIPDPPRRSRPRSRLRLALLGALGIVVVVWAVLLGFAAITVRDELVVARAALFDARDEVRAADVDAAGTALDRAAAALANARERLERPDVAMAAALPAVGNSLDVAREMTVGADEVARAAAATLAVLESTDGSAADDDLPLDALGELRPLVRATADAAAAAHRAVAGTPDTWVLAPVREARQDFLELLDPVAEEADRAADLVEVLGPFLGSQEPRRYFLAAANPAESRGASGYLGAFAIATFDDGDFDIGRFQALSDLPAVARGTVAPPTDWFTDRYDRFGGTGAWQNLNMTPDFPAAATAIERLWAATTGEQLDGTIVVDPFAFEALLTVSGGVDVPGGPALDSGNVVDYVTNTAYTEIEDPDARKAVLGAVAASTLERFLASLDSEGLRDTAEVLGELVRDDHLMLHAVEPTTQQVFERLNIAGALPEVSGDFLAVVTNSSTASKVDYYASRHLDYSVELGADGRAKGELDVTIDNAAPVSGVPQYVIGPNSPRLEAGENNLLVSVYAATSATITGRPTVPGPVRVESEAGHPVVTNWARIPAGDSIRMNYAWTVDDAWREVDGRLVYRVTHEDQVTVRPTELTVAVAVPNGFRVVTAPPRAVTSDGRVTATVAGADTQLEFVFEPIEVPDVTDSTG